ncbi:MULTISPECIES: hypothetical protein [Pseudomonas]|uniref:hypothetical protein n=1 Tax=Pseudomonas TaxID=286 RepID=UPI0013006090|nr:MULTISPECIES: hypothetical protein [Pseudomonas]MCU1724245.1 hypothetical protein [Pseudomonas sp. 5P_5.1_Bac1]
MTKSRAIMIFGIVSNVLALAFIIANLKIDKECSTVDQSCETVRYSLMGATLWQAPGK